MANQQVPIPVSQQMLATFVSKYRLQRASLGLPGQMVTFFMNPDVTQQNQWVVSYKPTGSGYVRWTFGAQYYTLALQGTTGVVGYDSGDAGVGGMKQLFRTFAPGWGTVGNGNQDRRFRFIYPAMGINTLCYVDSFQRSMTSQNSLYTFFAMQLTVLPPRVAADYETFSPAHSGTSGAANASNVAPGALIVPTNGIA